MVEIHGDDAYSDRRDGWDEREQLESHVDEHLVQIYGRVEIDRDRVPIPPRVTLHANRQSSPTVQNAMAVGPVLLFRPDKRRGSPPTATRVGPDPDPQSMHERRSSDASPGSSLATAAPRPATYGR